ncbi:DUF4919 domain-containing protein [Echinicola rosea]|uniref:DUF4919 domain-containing protein n=1 Tax=Echinicola rosea TaxID=1807691 RepID=A0ABQ1V3A2_9BACT|nr:DUF4919 domain-containing protein [Echinicola rosea]GGF34652.1 hypothetical protein GCM10011339_23650 [Echinicola rosea]
MKKVVIFCFVFLYGQVCEAQYWDFEKPDYEKIAEAIKDEASLMHYPPLLERYQRADSTLSLIEMRHLYYGFVFHPAYTTDEPVKVKDSLDAVLRKEVHHDEDLKQIVRLGSRILEKNPFDLKVMNYQLYAVEQLKDTVGVKKITFKMDMIFETLLSSGDGATKETAFFVIDPAHELILMETLGLRSGDKRQAIGKYDFLELAANDIGLEGLYFDLSPQRNFLINSLRNNNL